MRRRKIFSAAVVFGIAFLAVAQDALLAPKSSADWVASGNETALADKESAVLCTGKGNVEIITKNLTDVDPAKSYSFSGVFKAEAASAAFKCYFGLFPFDGKGQEIRTNQINFIKGTDTELAADCSPDDTVLKIKDAGNWKPNPIGCIAFETDNSGKYADLPNSKLSSAGILKIDKKDGVYEVTIKSRCGVKYPAGTKIRMHSAGPSAMYGGAAGKTFAAEWTEIKGRLKPGNLEDMNLIVNLWPGTRKVKIYIGFYPEEQGSGIAVMIKDVKLEELK